MARDIGRRRFLTGAGAAITMAAVGTPAYATDDARDAATANDLVDVQLLDITDLHGYLQSAPGGNSVIQGAGGATYTVGGIGYMAAHLERLRAGRRNSLFFAPGDLFSGWEFDAMSLADEPSIEALNRLGLDFATAGNHEFDKSPSFLVRHMEHGVPFPVAGQDDSFPDSAGLRFKGARFRYYSANMVWAHGGRSVLPPYNIEWVDAGNGRRLPIGFIHLTAIGTDTGSTSYQPALASLDEVATANRCAAELKRRGVNAIVLSMHDGAVAGSDFSSGSDPSGPAYDLALKVSPDIDAIVTGHWHCRFTMMVPDPNGVPRPFVEAGCYGQVINEINLRLDPRTGAVVRELTTSVNHPNTRDVTPDPELQEIADYWTGYAARRGATVIGRQTASFTRTRNAAGESTMGNLVADWAYWAGRQPLGPMNDGNDNPNVPADLALVAAAPRVGQSVISRDLTLDSASGGAVTLQQAWNAVGYGDPILTVTVTGQQILAALEEQWYAAADGSMRFAPLAVSANVGYSFDATAAAGSRVRAQDVLIDGAPLRPDASYRLAATAYTLLGADGFTSFAGFAAPVRHVRDYESFVAFVRAQESLTPAALGRVSVRNADATTARIGDMVPHAQSCAAFAAGRDAPAGADASAESRTVAAQLTRARPAGTAALPC
ncbi:bifunctional metallophosphatase/5'-nucleotidase [Actinacidiphila acididurans]|uniref:Bifunctional metallophosphatase/5'-nucleotidase n=1 Tax=Actinacidiphila acididurans TaxID=2784346 RepID=A0ABS2TZZ8_9ACTN|nr:bifunctional metallophosphatase/5'-nucleotidase [Actinacidiphila acididurans]MBM9508647.1 bifunctional metallophosphatase/5'-nucleotidase [Actinacidiphila acididurans]